MTSCRTTQERFCLMPFFFKILNIMRLRIGVTGQLKDEYKLKGSINSKDKYSIMDIDGVKSLESRNRYSCIVRVSDDYDYDSVKRNILDFFKNINHDRSTTA